MRCPDCLTNWRRGGLWLGCTAAIASVPEKGAEVVREGRSSTESSLCALSRWGVGIRIKDRICRMILCA